MSNFMVIILLRYEKSKVFTFNVKHDYWWLFVNLPLIFNDLNSTANFN